MSCLRCRPDLGSSPFWCGSVALASWRAEPLKALATPVWTSTPRQSPARLETAFPGRQWSVLTAVAGRDRRLSCQAHPARRRFLREGRWCRGSGQITGDFAALEPGDLAARRSPNRRKHLQQIRALLELRALAGLIVEASIRSPSGPRVDADSEERRWCHPSRGFAIGSFRKDRQGTPRRPLIVEAAGIVGNHAIRRRNR